MNTDLLFYTNNRNLRSFLEIGAINCKTAFVEDDQQYGFGNISEWGLLLVNYALDAGFLKSFEDEYSNVYNVVLKVDVSNCGNLPALLISTDYQAVWSTLGHFDPELHSFVLICGYLPFSHVKEICFNTEEEKNRLISSEFANIRFPKEIFVVSPSYFNGSLFPDLGELDVASTEGKNSLDMRSVIRSIRTRDRLKGMFLASFAGFELRSNDELILDFDKALLELVASYEMSNDTNYSFSKDLEYIFNLVNRSTGRSLELDVTLPEDPSPFEQLNFPYMFDTIHDLSKVDALGQSDIKNGSSALADRTAYQQVIKLLLLEPQDIQSGGWITPWLSQFKLELESKFAQVGGQTWLETVLPDYIAGIDKIVSVVRGDKRLRDILEDSRFSSYTLRALLLISVRSRFKDFGPLRESMDTFGINSFEKRMVWSLYGLLHGVSALGSEFKKDRRWLKLAEKFSCSLVENQHLITPGCFSTFTQTPALILKETAEFQKIQSTSTLGIPVRIIVLNMSEIIRARIGNLLNSPSEETLRDQIIYNINIPKEYLSWEIVFNQDFNISPAERQIKVKTKHERTIIKVWDDWKGFVRKCLSSQEWFKRSWVENRATWDRIVSETEKQSRFLGPKANLKQEKAQRKNTRKGS